MELAETTPPTVGAELVASDQVLAAVAELMEPLERLVADPPLYTPPASFCFLLLASPTEPDDDPDDE